MAKLDQFLLLSHEWIAKVKSQGESGMGYHIATVKLKDGREFPQSVIMLPYLGGIRGLDDTPFRVEEIDDIVVTHAKWDWSKETWNK